MFEEKIDKDKVSKVIDICCLDDFLKEQKNGIDQITHFDTDKFDVKINSLRWGNTPMNALDENNPNDLPILQRILKSNELPEPLN